MINDSVFCFYMRVKATVLHKRNFTFITLEVMYLLMNGDNMSR